ncbi:efflux RND transporter periplasmic adaptor subunit [Nannocystaceae bacterium ST9]
MRSLRRHLLAFIVIASISTSTSGCGGAEGAGPGGGQKGGQKGGGRGPGGGPQEPLAVEVVKLEPATIERHHRASGTLEAKRRAEIRPIRTGIIDELLVEVGDVVEVDQTLARLDGRELSLQAQRDSLTATNASRELERLRELEGSDAIASQEIDTQRYTLDTAKASAKLSRAQAASMVVKAPFAGTILAREVDVGNLASTGTILYELADLSALELPLHLPEREAAKVTTGAEVEIELIDGTIFTGSILRRAPKVDALTGTVEFTVRAETYPALAVPGAFVRARVLLERRESVPSLPARALFELEGQRYVYVLREGKARRVAVEIGLEGAERTEIRGGLTADDRVLSSAQGVTEGMPVKVAGESGPPEPKPPGEGGDAAAGAKQGGGKQGWGGGRRR